VIYAEVEAGAVLLGALLEEVSRLLAFHAAQYWGAVPACHGT